MSMDHREAIRLLTYNVVRIGTEDIDLQDAFGRILGEDIMAQENVPPFDRSPYDGYAFMASDTEGASADHPVKLSVIESIRAGQMPQQKVTKGTAIRLMTGAPVPKGSDAICKFEDTQFTERSVTIGQSFRPGDNIITAGEDIKKGTRVASKGYPVDAGMSGMLASLGILSVSVYKRPVAGLITTGDEVMEPGDELIPGKIRNSNRYIISAALKNIGIDTVFLGHANDTITGIAELISQGEASCDIIISTGGVSVGDYDLVPDAMEECGFRILARGVMMKPGMACAYGIKDNKLMLALSGNPASSLTNLQCICYPALRKLAGYDSYDHEVLRFKLGTDILKAGGRGARFVRGRSVIREGQLYLDTPLEQGNVVISSAVMCNAYGILSGMQSPVASGTYIDGFFV